MSRRSERLSISAKITPARSHKRAASNTAISDAKAKRSKSRKANATKSKYFKDLEAKLEATEDEVSDGTHAEESSSDDDEISDFAEEDEKLTTSDSDGEASSGSDEFPKSGKSAKRGKGATPVASVTTKSSELWRPGVKAGLGPGNQVVIKKPQARAAGKTPYQDHTIHPNTLLFLKELKANNERQWLKSKSCTPYSDNV